MNAMAMSIVEDKPEFNYHLLRYALQRFGKNPGQLRGDEYQQALRKASHSFDLETRVIASNEAHKLVITPEQVADAVAQIRARYASVEEFTDDLQTNGLDESTLRDALYRELLFDGVMQQVGAQAAQINELDIQLFYEMHHERFEQPETRKARHILVTVNEDFAENTRAAARARIDMIAHKLGQRGHRFARFARQYSECPTAMEGGVLGDIARGKLFAELDAQLFALEADEIGPVVESELGFHILWCEKIRPAKRIPLARARAQIAELLIERRRRNCQKHWLAELAAKKGAGCEK
jgi:peptidyl-prolyl cis-trans isomerase C